MSPSLLQLQAVGAEDVYLTQNPQINMFKYTYYRYVNFAAEVKPLELNEAVSFGKKATCNVPMSGHLLSKMYLHLRLPRLQKMSGDYVCWSDAIGYSIFDGPIELEIEGVIVDKLYPVFLDMWDELATPRSKRLGRDMMLGKGDTFRSNVDNASTERDIIIPLDFWFTKQHASALPLLSMYTQNIRLHFSFRKFDDVINYNGGVPPSPANIVRANVYAEYLFLDDVILEDFRNQKHMYIIEQVEYHGDESIRPGTTIHNTSLKFNRPLKELVFGCVDARNLATNNYMSFSHQDTESPLVSTASLWLDGKQRFESFPELFYRTVFPDSVHSNVPMKYIYTMPFSLRPEDNQPTGSLNTSLFNDVVLSLRMNPGNPECYVHVYALMYNVVTVENGTLTFQYMV